MTVQDASRTLTAKLLPPEPPDGFVHRPELLERLDDAVRRRLTTVVAGAGYGKSTLVSSWARPPECVWLTCDRADRSLNVFVRGLAECVRVRSPLLAEQFVAAADGPDESSRAGPVAAFMCGALEELAGNLVLVLDDVHELGRTSASVRLLAAICRQAPVDFHLVLCSREQPPFSIERLRGRGEVVDIRASDLALSEEEIDEMLAALLGERDRTLAAALHGLTGGWSAAVRLAVEALRTADDRDKAMQSFHGLASPLFSYLAEEVLAAQPTSLRELLRMVAPFERVTAELCEALGIDRAEEALETAAQRGLVVPLTEDGDQWFGVHQLVREVIEASSALPKAELGRLRRRSASWLESHGQLGPALRQLIAVEDQSAIARFLALHGDELLATGAVSTVVAAGRLVPERLWTSALDQVLGRAHYPCEGYPDVRLFDITAEGVMFGWSNERESELPLALSEIVAAAFKSVLAGRPR